MKAALKITIILILAYGLSFMVFPTNYGNEAILLHDKHFWLMGNDDARTYSYYIINNEGRIVDRGYVERIAPTIQYIPENIIKICFHGGTYANLCKFYSISQDRFSDHFWNPYLVENGLIVYYDVEGEQLIVQNIFSKDLFFKSFHRNIIPTGHPENIEFLEMGQKLLITYLRAGDYEEMTEILQLH